MPFSFQEAVQAFKDDRIRELSQDRDGLRFLKLRSLSRAEFMRRLLRDSDIEGPNLRSSELLEFLYNSQISNEEIDCTINAIYLEERNQRRHNENELVSELYKVTSFDWGGLHQNSLERTIVDNYVKKITSFDTLSEKIENEIHHSMRAYVQNSWYNHWSSIIIEDVFRDHPNVLPAVGLIKKIDFFINNIPFDLKVTYLPEGYIKDRRQEQGLRPELTLLKAFCRSRTIHFDGKLPNARLLEDLWAKLEVHPSDDAVNLIQDLREKRLEYLEEAIANPPLLIRWLYENQGVRRFDASNRLFLVLVDKDNFFESWKLKRAKPLVTEKVHQHLDQMVNNSGHEVLFIWEGEEYIVTSDLIFVVHSRNH